MPETPNFGGGGAPEDFRTIRGDRTEPRRYSTEKTPPRPYDATERIEPAPEPPSDLGPMKGSSEFDIRIRASAAGGLSIAPGMTLFDEYKVESKIGEGGMGSVWKVHNEGLGTSTALKVISETNYNDEARERLKREARLMALVKHPNAVVVHRSKVTREFAFIEMEFLKGRSLDRIIQRGEPLELVKVARVVEQVCGVLEYAHEQVVDAKGRPVRIVHRDLKPSNLMVLDDRTGGAYELKVLDLGIAKQIDFGAAESDAGGFKTSTGGALFTLPYASPEQISAKADIDEKTDVYSLGVILYELLTGYLPFTEPGLVYKQLMEAPPTFAKRNPVAKCPPAIEALVMRCLSKNPVERPTARRLCEEFFAALPADFPVLPRTSAARAGVDSQTAGPRWPTQAKTMVDSGATGKATLHEPPTSVRTQHTWRDEGSSFTRRNQRKPGASPPVAAILAAVVVVVGIVVGLVFATRGGGGSGDPQPGPGPNPGPVAKSEGASSSTPSTKGVEAAHKPAPLIPVGYEVVENSGEIDGHPMRIRRVGVKPEIEFVYLPTRRFRWGIDRNSFNFKERTKGAPADQPPRPTEKDDLLDDSPDRDLIVAGFYIQVTEVTNGEIAQYMRLKPASQISRWENSLEGRDLKTMERHPAVCVPREFARDYAKSKGGDLPTELQWEYAARSADREYRPYTWLDEKKPADLQEDIRVNQIFADQKTADAFATTRDKTKQGVLGLMGNAREWCLDDWAPYPPEGAAARAEVPTEPPPHIDHTGKAPPVIRGGSWRSLPEHCETTWPRRLLAGRDDDTMEQIAETRCADDVGFRVVLPIPAASN